MYRIRFRFSVKYLDLPVFEKCTRARGQLSRAMSVPSSHLARFYGQLDGFIVLLGLKVTLSGVFLLFAILYIIGIHHHRHSLANEYHMSFGSIIYEFFDS